MIGIDEVGRGAWAGPLLVVAAKLKDHNDLPEGLTDSKLLTITQKEQFFQQLLITCEFGEGWVTVKEIDQSGLSMALKLGCMRAIAGLVEVEGEEICIDGNINYLSDLYPKSFALVGADLNEPIVSAASVYAKVKRDKAMQKLHYELPNYGFNKHVGYGTQQHIKALKDHGVSIHHRRSFKPIAELI